MTEREIFTKNLIFSTEFDRYLIEHPEYAEKVPLNAQIVFLPEGDEELCRVNMEMAEHQREKGQQVVLVHIGAIAPQVSRLTRVTLEVKAA